MKRWVVVQYLLESGTLEQITIVEANTEIEARHKANVEYGNMAAIICCDDVKPPYKFFKTFKD